MPELPEVETIRKGLEKRIIGLRIKDIEVLWPKSFIGDPKKVLNKEIKSIWRRGKVLGIEFEADNVLESRLDLLLHLKMSGQIVLMGPSKSTRVIFTLSDGDKLYFNDQRKFGWIKVVNNEELKEFKFFNLLGPEPLEAEFTWQVLKDNLLKHKNSPVKVVILDQSVVSGIGNIYASEALFLADIDPRRKVNSLSDEEIKKLNQAIKKTLAEGIEHGGSSRTHYVNIDGKRGDFLNQANVYNRDKQRCKICRSLIQKIRLGGRGTFFCPNCQK